MSNFEVLITSIEYIVKALVLKKAGTPETLSITDHAQPVIHPGHVFIGVKAIGLNPVDYQTARWGNKAWSWPHILGLDVAGVIAEVDTNNQGWNVGDRVYYHGNPAKPDGYAEYAIAPQHILTHILEDITFEDAVALPCAGFNAWQILSRKVKTHPGEDNSHPRWCRRSRWLWYHICKTSWSHCAHNLFC